MPKKFIIAYAKKGTSPIKQKLSQVEEEGVEE